MDCRPPNLEIIEDLLERLELVDFDLGVSDAVDSGPI
jgi:hypothetical protein